MTRLEKIIRKIRCTIVILIVALGLFDSIIFRTKSQGNGVTEILTAGHLYGFGTSATRIDLAPIVGETLFILNNNEPIIIEKIDLNEISYCTFSGKSGRRLAITALEKNNIYGITITNLETGMPCSIEVYPESKNLFYEYMPEDRKEYYNVN